MKGGNSDSWATGRVLLETWPSRTNSSGSISLVTGVTVAQSPVCSTALAAVSQNDLGSGDIWLSTGNSSGARAGDIFLRAGSSRWTSPPSLYGSTIEQGNSQSRRRGGVRIEAGAVDGGIGGSVELTSGVGDIQSGLVAVRSAASKGSSGDVILETGASSTVLTNPC